MKNNNTEIKITIFDIIGIACFVGVLMIGFVWIKYIFISLLFLTGWICLCISDYVYPRKNRKK